MNNNASEVVGEITTETLDSLLSYLLDNEIIDFIPIFGTSFKISKASKSIRDFFFCKKMARLLKNIDYWDSDDRNKLKIKLNDPKDKGKTATKLIYTVEKIDEDKKSDWIAESLLLYTDDKISNIELFRLLNSIKRIVCADAYRTLGIKKKELLS